MNRPKAAAHPRIILFPFRCVYDVQLTVPLILEKLTANVASAKLDSVLTLSEAAPVFGAKELAQYIEGIWLGLKTEVSCEVENFA